MPDKVIGQLLRYMGWVKVNLSQDKMVRGIIVGQELVDAIKLAVVGIQTPHPELVKLKTLNLNIEANIT